MDFFTYRGDEEREPGYGDQLGTSTQRDTSIQLVLSAVLGVGAFLTFCFLRPRWKSLYAARKRTRDEATRLPDLPDSFFGWIPALYRVTEQQILASAGLDAYVFLRFFKLACKFLSITLFFSLVVFKPVHDAFPEPTTKQNGTRNGTGALESFELYRLPDDTSDVQAAKNGGKGLHGVISTDYLWMYLVFVYVLSGIIIYLIVTETERIINIRQQFLGALHTVTDRTIRLSGIPVELRSEDKIKQYVEELGIGKVDSVTLCRRWEELDDCMDQRMNVLRKLEEAWTVFLSHRRIERSSETLPISQPLPGRYSDDNGDDDDEERRQDGEDSALHHHPNGHHDLSGLDMLARPKATLRYGFLRLRFKTVDAIDYYEEVLAGLDERIKRLREKEYEPMPLAFVTMDTVVACQMAIQATLDPKPMQLIAKTSPAPADVLWRNTYLPRWQRMTRAWAITIVITLLTVFWSLVLVPLATALNLKSIDRVWPQLAEALKSHPFAQSLVETQLPTLISSLLFVLVPYLYDWLANCQGMTSQGDVDMSVTAKNFFFVFFNYFVVFTLLGTFTNFYDFQKQFEDSLKDTTRIAWTLAQSLEKLLKFYTNLIILQGVGLFPFRLLEFGSVALYPIYRMGSKTPRDYAELVQPPKFFYGFYLPQVMLIFIICMVYSCLRNSWQVLLAGLIYFLLGGFVYKYQLLYAMDHRQQATGRGWMMICNRVIIGVFLFQLNMAGQLALKGAVRRAAAVSPLLLVTVWFSYWYSHSFEPLMKFISLGSIERTRSGASSAAEYDPDGWGEQASASTRYQVETRPGNTVDESAETGTRFINPSLVAPLEDVWIADKEIREVQGHSLAGRQRLEGALNAAI